MAAANEPLPGSDTVGVPASDTSAMLSPAAKPLDERDALSLLVVLVKARCRGRDGVACQQMSGPPSVFGGDQRDLAQHPQRSGRDVFEIADGRGDHEQRAGHEKRKFIVPLADRAG